MRGRHVPPWGTPGSWRGNYMSECADNARKTRTTRTTVVLAGAALLAPLGLLARPVRPRADGGVWDRMPSARAAGTGTSTPATATTGDCSFRRYLARVRRLRLCVDRGPGLEGGSDSRGTKVQHAQGWGAWPSARTCRSLRKCPGTAGHQTAAKPSKGSTTRSARRSSRRRRRSVRRDTRGAGRPAVTTPSAAVTPERYAERHGTTWQRLYARNKAVIGGDPM